MFYRTANPSRAPEFTPGFIGVRVTRSLVLYVCFVDRCLSSCTFSFGHCVVCSSSIYGFWLPLNEYDFCFISKLRKQSMTDWHCLSPVRGCASGIFSTSVSIIWVRVWLLLNANSAIFVSYIMARRSQFSMRWRWSPLCTRPTSWISAGSLKQHSAGRHVAALWHIALIPSQLVVFFFS